ncbi:MAG: permease [Firmicutes bacterium]|nr:permease [Bacillota bacterium]
MRKEENGNNQLMLVYGVMAALTAALVGAAFAIAPERIVLEINKSYFAMVEVLPAAMVSIVVATTITALIPAKLIAKWADDRVRGVLIATAAGMLIPCEPMLGLPVILGLVRGGAGIGFIVALLTSSKLFSLMRIPDYFAFLDFKLAAVFLACALAMPFMSGLLATAVAGHIGWRRQ